MASVGVRELRQSASELLRRVEGGETIQVTDRGRPVAILGPVRALGALDQLRALGETTGKSRGMAGLGKPIVVAHGAPGPSAVLAGLRRNER